MASDLGNLKDYRKTGPLDDGAEKPISKGRGRGRGFSFKNRQMNSQGVGVHSACDSATKSSQTHSQTGQFNHYNENSSDGIKFSPKTRSSMDNGFNPVGNDDLRTQRKDDDVKEFYCPHGGAKPKQNYVQGVGNHGIQSSMDRGSDNTSTMTGMRGKGFGTPTSPSHGSNSQSLNKSNYVSTEDSRGRSHYRDEEFNHERDTSPDRTGFQHRGQHAHQSRSLQRDVEHERESSPDRQGFCDEEPHKVHTPTHSKNDIGYTTPDNVQNNSATNRNKRDRSDERQKGSRYNGRYKDRENWGGNRRSGNGWNSPKNGNYPSSPQSGNEWSSPKSDTSQSPMSETSSPRHKKYRDKNPMVHLSKTLSFILRHGAERKGFKIMQGGYLYVDEILQLPELHEFTEKDVESVVQNNDKQRFALETEDGTERLKIRANQGHSIQVEGLELTPVLDHKEIPVVVHGTYLQTWNIIKKEGLSRMNRNHIHFAPGEPQDNGVISGMRASCEVMIFIDAQKSLNEGLKFYRSANNVILSPGDPDGYIHPRYFSTVLQRVPRDVLEFDPDVQVIPRKAQDPVTSPLGPSIPGLAVDTTTRRKKKGKRRGKGAGNDSQQGTQEVAKNMNDSIAKNVDDSVTMEDSRTENLDDSVTMDGDNQHVKEDDSSLNIDWNLQEALGEDVPIEENIPPENWDDDDDLYVDAKENLSQTDSANSAENYDSADSSAVKSLSLQTCVNVHYIKIEDAESSRSVKDFLSDSKRECVAVYCHITSDNQEVPTTGDNREVPTSGDIQDITDILFFTDDYFHHFDLKSGIDVMEEGNLADFFNSKSPVKIFHGISTPSAVLFKKYGIILDGTDVFDTQIAMELIKELGEGDLNQLEALGFTSDRMESDIEGSLDDLKIQRIKEKCHTMFYSYKLFDSWLEKKKYKKRVYDAVNQDIDATRLREVRNDRKKKAKSLSSNIDQNQQQGGQGKKKNKGRKK